MTLTAGIIIVLMLALWVSAAVRFIGAIFSARMRTQIADQPILHGIWFLAALLLGAAVLFLPPFRSTRESLTSRTRRTMAYLETACQTYQTEYGSFPAGDNAAIIKVLQGSNPRNIIFYEFKGLDTNSAGEAIDPWGTPYRFTLEDGKKPVIRSAGPDRVFETKDDLSRSSP